LKKKITDGPMDAHNYFLINPDGFPEPGKFLEIKRDHA